MRLHALATACALTAAAIAGCHTVARAFTCATDLQCGEGRCEADGHCSVLDDTCDSGRRYGEFAGDRAGACVEPTGTGDTTTGEASETTDATDTEPTSTTDDDGGRHTTGGEASTSGDGGDGSSDSDASGGSTSGGASSTGWGSSSGGGSSSDDGPLPAPYGPCTSLGGEYVCEEPDETCLSGDAAVGPVTVCGEACEVDRQCPPAPEGLASPICFVSGYCLLDCDLGSLQCPTGMVCGTPIGICVWPQ